MKILLFICAFAWGATEKNLPSALGIDPTTTKGELELILGEAVTEKEKIVLGTGGRYGLGLLFQNKDLPEHYRKELKGSDVIQFVFGNTVAGIAPQFGALSLMLRGGDLAKKHTYVVQLPNPKAPSYHGTGLLLFASPKNPASQSNEEKLKKTYFCRTGNVTYSLKPDITPVTIKLEGKNLNFQKRTVRMDLIAELTSPFNPFPARIKGWAEVPLLIPSGGQSGSIVTRYAIESLEKVMPFQDKGKPAPKAKPKQE